VIRNEKHKTAIILIIMNKLFFALLLTLTFGTITNAQTNFGVQSSVGVTLAPNETTFVGEFFDYINHEVTYKGSNIVKSYGVFAQKEFGFLYGRAELAYTHYKQEFDVRSFVQFGQGTRTFYENFGFLDFQVMAGVKKDNIRLGVGPVAHILLSHDPALDIISGYSDNLRNVTFGFTTGIGIDAGRFHLDLRYVNNFTTIGDHIIYGTRNAGFDVKPHQVNFTLGFSI